MKGDAESKQLIQRHTPEMALALQKLEEWDKSKNGVALVCNEDDLNVGYSEDILMFNEQGS